VNRHAKASSVRSTLRRTGGLGLLVLLVAMALAPAANAGMLVEFGKFATTSGTLGGQVKNAEGMAVNRSGAGGVQAGDVYVGDRANFRVQQFTKNGAFVRAWGKDVIATGQPTNVGTGFEICEVASECKAGVSSAEAGAFAGPRGIAVDQATGNVYVLDGNNRRVAVYSAKGKFEGAFGWKVKVTGAAEELQLCTTASGCQAGKSTAAGGGFATNGLLSALAVDPGNGHLWIGDNTNHRINEFSFALNGSEEVTGVSFVRALGWKVNATTPIEGLQSCTTASGCQVGTVGAGGGQFGTVRGLAVDSSGAIYAIDNNNTCTAATPCRVEKFNPDGTFKETFGPSSGKEAGCQVNWNNGGAENGNPGPGVFADPPQAIAVDPVTQHVFVLRLLSELDTPLALDICEFDSAGTLVQRSPISPIPTNISGARTLSIGTEERVYLQATNDIGTSWPITFFGIVPAAPATVLAPTNLTPTSATLKGEVTVPNPGGTGFDVRYRFEYSPDNGLTWLRAPSAADASVGTTVSGTYPVQQDVSGLLPNNTYRVRLVTSTSFVTTSEEKTFATPVGPPLISEVRARDASQSSVVIEAKINPSGSPTNYHFEWGPTASYGNDVPVEFDPFVGSGHQAAQVSAKLTGLAAGTAYHYRVVAHSTGGTTATPDQVAETLNSCGLPEERCFELVSRSDAGPVAIPGEFPGSKEIHYQAATEGENGLAYVVEAGYPESTKGAEVLYRGTRGPSGWSSTQLSTPLLAQNEQSSGESGTGPLRWLSDDLSCGFAESFQPLTADPATQLVREYSGSNLYRINPDGSYTAVTNLAPENPDAVNFYQVAFASQDCGKVLFETTYHYPGIPGAGAVRLYEWDEGTLRNAGVVPGPSGAVVVAAVPGTGASFTANSQNTVSEDGSRVFFSAKRQTSPNPAEIGKDAIFVREDGSTTRDLSLSETATPDEGATYQWATPDGSKVFFTANAGLTADSSSEGTDLYEYDLETEGLTDLTPYPGAGGARVAGFIGASEDGSRVYFASSNQLVPGEGSTLAENQSDDTLSIYAASDGEFSYVGAFSNTQIVRERVTIERQREWTSRTSPDGRYLLFQSSVDVTGYDSGGAPEAYLYDSEASSEATVCVSCRQDGQPSIVPTGYPILPTGEAIANVLNGPQFLTMHGGRPQVFFSSPDALAPGAVEDQNNVYEWSHGQVFRLVSAQEGQQATPFGGYYATFAGASADGSDAYLITPETLTWEDGDARLSAYVARVGGGFPEPPPPPPACEPTAEGSCQGPAQGGPALPGAASAAFSGPGNPAPQAEKKAKKHKKKHAKRKHKRARHANANRRAGK